MCRLMFALLLAVALFISGPATARAAEKNAKSYQKQHSQATIGTVKATLASPDGFVRIDGLDNNLDSILVATQPLSLAVLALYAEAEAWKIFNDGQTKNNQNGLVCYALATTPIDLASQTMSLDEFAKFKNELKQSLSSGGPKKDHDLAAAMGVVSNHQIKSAKGSIDSFQVLDDKDDFLTYKVKTSMEIKLKGEPTPIISSTQMVSSAVLLGGKIIILEIKNNGNSQDETKLAETARSWRDSFIKKNKKLKNQ